MEAPGTQNAPLEFDNFQLLPEVEPIPEGKPLPEVDESIISPPLLIEIPHIADITPIGYENNFLFNEQGSIPQVGNACTLDSQNWLQSVDWNPSIAEDQLYTLAFQSTEIDIDTSPKASTGITYRKIGNFAYLLTTSAGNHRMIDVSDAGYTEYINGEEFSALLYLDRSLERTDRGPSVFITLLCAQTA